MKSISFKDSIRKLYGAETWATTTRNLKIQRKNGNNITKYIIKP